VWTTLLKTVLGIDTIPKNEPIDYLIEQHTGLPFINGLLNYSLDEFVRNSQILEFRESVLKKIDNASNSLFLIVNEQELETITYTDGSTISRKKKRWWQEKGSELEYAWVETELFP
jgi:hypothetical protein